MNSLYKKLAMIAFVSASLTFSLLQLDAQTSYLYVGCQPRGDQVAIDNLQVFSFDQQDGTLTHIQSIDGYVSPWHMTLSADDRNLYVSDNNQGVAVFSIDRADGMLTLVENQFDREAVNPTYVTVSPLASLVVTSNFVGNDVTVYRRHLDGSLSDPIQVVEVTGPSVVEDGEEIGNVLHSAVFSRNGRFLFVGNTGGDDIRVFSVDYNSDTPLTLIHDVDTNLTIDNQNIWHGPRHMIMDPANEFLYVIGERSGYVSVFRHNQGALTFVQAIPAYSVDPNVPEFRNRPGSDIIMSKDGRFLYTNNRTDDPTIAVFSIDENDGTLTLVEHETVTLPDDRHWGTTSITLDPSNNFLIATGTREDSISVLSRDPATGELTYLADKEIEGVSRPYSLKISGYNPVNAEFETWAEDAGIPSEDVNMRVDSDDDGLNDLLEFALGSSPLDRESGPGFLPTVSWASNSNYEFLQITFRRHMEHEDLGLTYLIEHTDDLGGGHWVETGYRESLRGEDGDFETIRARIPLPKDAGPTSHFGRLRVIVDPFQ